MFQGHLTFEGISCIFTKLDDRMIITPKDESDISKMYRHINKTNFYLEYSLDVRKKCWVYIERIQSRLDYSFNFLIKHSIELIGDYLINGLIMVGDEIDVFFSPSKYFYDKNKNGGNLNINLLYGREIAAKHNFSYRNQNISVTIYYGEILHRGIGSDLVLHPKLRIDFNKTKDIEFVYEVYTILLKFIQIVNYKRNYNLKPTEVIGVTEKYDNSHIGEIFTKPYKIQYYQKSKFSEYHLYGKCIGDILQTIADDNKFSIRHLPSDDDLYEYDVLRYLSVFAAFEYECKKNKEYSLISDDEVKDVKNLLLKFIDTMGKETTQKTNKDFLKNAKERISSLGTQLGQERKIINAFNKIQKIINSSLQLLFLEALDIKKVARDLSILRQKIVHENLYRPLTEYEVSIIRFLDVITFILFLKRVGLDDDKIEILIGAVFQCNFMFMEF